jgi:MFS family permease
VLAFERYGGSPQVAGWLLGSFSAGSVAGGLLAARLAARLPPLRLARAAVLGMPLPLWVLVVPAPAAVVGLAVGLNGLCSGLLFPPVMTLLTVRTPPRLRGRVIASAMTVFSAAGPLGLAGAGQAAQALGTVTPVLVGVAVVASASAAVFVGGTLGTAPVAGAREAS